ncbi:MAG: DUF362 domain-containing protein, partial [Chitinispirillaceae bacterium]|nr:DUF362 domain-containing protein [Chitinispirillaceae bacterium]
MNRRRTPRRRNPLSDDSTLASIASGPAAAPSDLVQECLDSAGFWKHLEATRLASHKSKADFCVVIKPDLEHFSASSSCGTSPELVEHLIMLLHRKGYASVAVVDGPGSAGTWLDNRDVVVLADLAGYRYVTDDDSPYDVLDLSQSCVDAGFAPGTALAGTHLSSYWLDADFRICFGKSKTHEEEFFALCLYTLMGVFPFHDKNYHCFGRLPAAEILSELLRHTPVHFALIDAITSNHGADGIRMSNPLPTNTVIGSPSLLLADMACALKMDLDPYASTLNSHALRTIGLPRQYCIKGDLTPWPGWKNVPPLLADSVRKRNRTLLLRRAVQPWTHSVDRLYFPFKREIDERVNEALAPVFSGLDDHPFKLLAAVIANYLLAQSGRALENYRILYSKEKLYRKTSSIGIDPDRFIDNDYESIPAYVEPFENMASHAPPDRNGLKWRTIDHSVVIEYRRILPFPFRKFVNALDIASAVRIMNDNIGGAVLAVRTDAKGRAVHQIERDIYLPQPNWMALFGGDFIDVTKTELVQRSATEHAIFWRSVASVNKTARFDDGIVRFSRTGDGSVSVTLVARQDFTLPLIWQMVDMDLFPHIKDPLVSDAYLTYFGRTLANYEAVFQGRGVRTGREFLETFGEPGGETPPHAMESFVKNIMAAAPIADIVKTVMEKGPTSLLEANPAASQAA